jgi:integrase/recombinase XerD
MRRSLPFDAWPEADRRLWRSIIRTGDILDGAGPGAGWSPVTKINTRKAYGYWLQWLKTNGYLDAEDDPLDRLTPEHIKAYLASRGDEIASLTAFTYILELLRLAQAAEAKRDWGWLKAIKNRLWARATPHRDKTSAIRPSSDLFELGLDLMDRAAGLRCRYNPYAAEVQYRDGLIIALLAARPVRLKNLAAITVGRHLVRIDGDYWLIFPAIEVKNGKAIEVSVPQALTCYIDVYLEWHRRRLLQGKTSQRLWVSRYGTPMAHNSIRGQIKARTEAAFGTALTPHLFRDCAATSIAIEDPDHVRMATAILGHYRSATTERYYNQARMLSAGRVHNTNVARLRQELAGDDTIDNHFQPKEA